MLHVLVRNKLALLILTINTYSVAFKIRDEKQTDETEQNGGLPIGLCARRCGAEDFRTVGGC